MTEQDARGHMLSEFYARIGGSSRGSIKPFQVMRRGEGKNFVSCIRVAEAMLYGIPGSELWDYGIKAMLPKRLETSTFTRNELRELARECKSHAKKLARHGYPRTAIYVREVALYYHMAARKTGPA